ncbi:MAG: HEAT repeat domain-containing protein [Candidatus Brocadiia bacterium]
MRNAPRLFAALLCLPVLAALAAGGEGPKLPSADDLLRELRGEAQPPERSAERLQAAYRAAVADLAACFTTDDMSQWSGSDRKLEALCHAASAPGYEAHRVALAKALVGQLDREGLARLGRRRIIRHIERVGREEAVPALAALLDDPEQREPARRALLRNPTDAALEALRAALAKAPDKEARLGLIDALAKRRDAGSLDALVRLAKSSDEQTRIHALEALAKIGDASAAPVLAAAQRRGSKHAQMRAQEAYLALADNLVSQGKSRQALPIYRSFLKGKTYLRCAALIGIGKAGGADDVEPLVAALGASDPERGAARQALGLLQGQEATKAIAAKARDAEPAVRAVLVRVLGERGDLAALPTVIEATSSPDENVRLAATQALGELRAETAVPTLIQALKKEKDALRDKAEWALSRIPAEKTTDAILAALEGTEGESRAVLVRSLGYRKDPRALPALLGAAREGRDAVRVAAFRAIGKLGHTKALPTVLEALKTAQGDLRDAAFYALRRTRGEGATEAIAEAARDAAPPVLAAIIQVLSWRQHPTVDELLLEGARHADAAVRAAAIEGLSRVHEPKAVPALIQAATTGEGQVRQRAVTTCLHYADEVAKADPEAAVAIFTLALNPKVVEHHEDRRQALRALGRAAGPESVDAICARFRDRRVAGDAEAAVLRIAQRLQKEGQKDAAVGVYKQFLRRSKDERRLREAQKALRDLGVEGEMPHLAGFVAHWWVCGPFPNPRNQLFSEQMPPEKEGVDLAQAVEAAGVARPWKHVHTTHPAGVVDLHDVVAREHEVAALLYAEVTVPEATDVLLKLGYEEGCVATVNGKKVHARAGSRLRIDDQRVKTRLQKGTNTILLKVTNLSERRRWRVCARITGRDHGAVDFAVREK